MKFASCLVFFSGMPFFCTCPMSALFTPSAFLTFNGLDQRFSILGFHLVRTSDLTFVLATTFSTTFTTTICSSSLLGAVAGNMTLFLASETDYIGILPFICGRGWSSSSPPFDVTQTRLLS